MKSQINIVVAKSKTEERLSNLSFDEFISIRSVAKGGR